MACHLGPEHHIWPRARAAALERDGHRCRRCGTTEDLHVHHRIPVNGDRSEGCQHHLEHLLTVCPSCHRAEHAWLRQRRVQQLAFGLAA